MFYFYFFYIILSLNIFSLVLLIHSERITYHYGIGLIDWGHARKDGTVDFINRIGNNKKYIYYTQSMSLYFLNASVTSYFLTSKLASKDDLYFIFKNVSTDFENMQINYPFNVIPFVSLKQIENEDINGNNISFYCAYNTIDVDKFKNNISDNKTHFIHTFFYCLYKVHFYNSNSCKNTKIIEYQKFYKTIKEKKTIKKLETIKKIHIPIIEFVIYL